jgi:AcrR family transcriptional regulator
LDARLGVGIRDATATKARILEAATTECAAHGLAGARVDRLATRAGANKERIYAYYGSKEGLFDAAIESNIEQLLDAVPFTAEDLPGYAEALFSFNLAHPEFTRLALWHMLERPGVMARLPQTAASTVRKIEAVGRAQRAGLVDDSLPPDQMVELVLAVVHSGLILPPGGDPDDIAARQKALRTAIQRLAAPSN